MIPYLQPQMGRMMGMNEAEEAPSPEIGLEEYIVHNVPDQLTELLQDYDMPQPQSIEEALMAVDELIAEHGEDAVKDLLSIHPDKEALKEAGAVSNGGIPDNIYNKLPTWGKYVLMGLAVYGIFKIIRP